VEPGPESTPHRHVSQHRWGDPAEPPAAGGSDDVVPIREAVRPWALQVLVAAYGGDTYRLLTDLADLLGASVAYVDRPTVEAHLERPLSDGDWSAVAAQFGRVRSSV
jgi:hypothetical protein